MSEAHGLKQRFSELYGGVPRIFRAPGRVNLIGEHTDYNEGFVMPAAIGLATRAAIGPASSRYVSAHSCTFGETATFDPTSPDAKPRKHWSDYVQGVALTLSRAGYPIRGANLAIKGGLPLGSGLSSSASLEVAVALALLANSGLALDRTEVALLCQRAENDFVGARCGVMDQFTACHGRKDCAILLDCRSLGARYLPLPPHVSLAVCNTMVRHELASGEYNRRRRECEEGVRVLSPWLPDVKCLRDVSLEQLLCFETKMDATIFRRCRHVIAENERVLAAASALEQGNLEEFGKLMIASHRSLRDDYEVSCPELNVLIDLAMRVEDVYGSRLTGGGFGGCTISLVEKSKTKIFSQTVKEGYLRETGIDCEIYICETADGAAEE